MAQRLAPERSHDRILSSPDAARPRWARRSLRMVLLLIVLAVGLALALVLAHFIVSRTPAKDIPAAALVPEGAAARVLVVLARPGQEVPLAGTLAGLQESGVQVETLFLTSGEAQPPQVHSGGAVARLRAEEAQQVGELLGAEQTDVADLPDGQLLHADPERVRSLIAAAVHRSTPSAVIAASDVNGTDLDSRALATYTVEVARQPGSGISRVWAATRSGPEVRWLLRGQGADGLPGPTAAVTIADPRLKAQVISTYATLTPDLVSATYPLSDRLPARAYFRFWDREYFSLLWGPGLN